MQGLNPALGRSREEGMAAHPSILAWRIPWTEEPGRLQSIETKNQTQLKWLNMHTCIECLFLRLIICKSASFFITVISYRNTVLILSCHFIAPTSYLNTLCTFFHICLSALYSVSIVTNNLRPSIPKFDIGHWLSLLPISFLIFFAKAFASFHMLEHAVFFLSLTDCVSQGTFTPPPELLSNTADLFHF